MHVTEDDIYRAKAHFSNFVERDFRSYQYEAIDFIMQSEKSVVVIEAPTGSGKSLIGAITSFLHNDSIYLVHSKSLQEQIMDEFPEFRLLFGRSNYECPEFHNSTAADCPYKNPNDSCKHVTACPYRVQKKVVAAHPLRVINYQYILSEWNYVGQLSGKPFVVCDEADKLEDVLLNFISLQISDWHMKKFKLPRPKYKTNCTNGIKNWLSWSRECALVVKEYIEKLDKKTPRKEIEQYSGLLQKLQRFGKLLDETWIYEEGTNRFGEYWRFAPTWITPEMTDEYLRRHVGSEGTQEVQGKLVLLSATLPPIAVLSKEIGVPVSEMDYMEVPSTFDPDNRKTYVFPVAKMSRSTTETEFPKMRDKIIEILNSYPTQKGLIHTSNYRIAELIMDINDDRLITHDGRNRIEQLNKFKTSDEPLVLVSPSMDRGVSLNDDLARFIIVAKMPFPDLGDKQVQTRMFNGGAMGKYWYRATAVQTLEQMVGRGVRTPDDYCDIYLLDAFIDELIARNRAMFSKHFLNCITW